MQPIQVVVLISCYNGKRFLDDCLGSLLENDEPGIDRRIVLVDNASTDDSGEYAKQHFPAVDVVRAQVNRGFTGGNNFGYAHIRRAYPGACYIVLLNTDTKVAPGWLRPMVDHLEANPGVGAVQAKLLLHPETDRINTIGDRSHYLGFGFMLAYRELDRGQYSTPLSIDYASGAAVMLRCDVLQRVGLFDESLYMYLEDTELCWKIRQLGLDIVTVPASVVYHKYNSNAAVTHYYWLERNRWILLLCYYRMATLVLLSPALLVMELGQLLYALRIGKLTAKLRSYGFFWQPRNWGALCRKRREAQRRRTVGDRAFMTRFAGTIEFEGVDNPLLRYVGNPILSAYWALARRLIFW